MKLLSCRIGSFGKLLGTTFDFSDGLTVIKQDNSFGKTTLANFIVSMFYGLPDLRVQDLSNDRRRYDPWQGGMYGGFLLFEYGERRYEIERDFSKNTFRLVDITNARREVTKIDGKAVDGSNLGEVLFGINKSGFKRSAYIPQDEIICSEVESGLNDKLRNLINATSQSHSLDKSLAILQRAAESIETKRGKGRLREVEERIAELSGKVAECEVCFDNAEQGRRELKQLEESLKKQEQDIKNLESQIKAQSETETLLAQKRHYETIRESITRGEERRKGLLSFFGSQSPSEVDLEKIKQRIENLKRQQARYLDTERQTLSERSRLLSLEEATLAKQERKSALIARRENLVSDVNRMREQQTALNAEIAPLEVKRQKGFLHTLLCIVTLGIYHFICKKRAARLSGLKSNAKELEDKIVLLQNSIDQLDGDISQIAVSSEDNGARLTELNQKLAEDEAQLAQLKQMVRQSFEGFNCASVGFDECYHEVKNACQELEKVDEALAENRQRLEEFLVGKDMTRLLGRVEIACTIDELGEIKQTADQKRLKCIKDIADISNRIKQYDERADELADFESELSACKETKQRLEQELSTLKRTAEFLLTANDNLAGRYLSPLLERSKQILQLYNSKSDIEFDASSRLMIRESGRERDLDYFSKGIREMVSISMRIALLDTLYSNAAKKPFLILDDPFVNLDDTKLTAAKEFIKTLSTSYQIIYLTCHTSRAL